MGELGARKYFVLATVVMMLGMIAVLAVPIILTEEAEKKTLDALLLVANYREVIVAKALVGVAYSAISVALMLALTRLQPADMPTFVAGTGLLAVALIGAGLLLGGVFKTANQVTRGRASSDPIIARRSSGAAVPRRSTSRCARSRRCRECA